MSVASDAGHGLLSIVVIGRNEGARLERCLRSVESMDRSGFATEVIYVDSGSSDGSVRVAAEMGARVVALEPEHPTAALGRNAGWRAAQGEFVLFLDGDTVLHPAFACASLPEFADSGVGVVWGHRRELYPGHSIYNRALDLDWIYAPGVSDFCGGDALFRRSLLERTNGFDDTLIAGEEPELCRRVIALGFTILHVDRPMTGHDLAMTHFSQYWRRAARAGHAFAEVAERFEAKGQGFWTGEVRRNRTRALLLLGAPLAAMVTATGLRSWWPPGLAAGAAALLVARTAWKARWKSRDLGTLVLYGVHSHLQQVPIFVGQMRFLLNRLRGRRAGLVEYRTASPGER